jgi:hypothetical protein
VLFAAPRVFSFRLWPDADVLGLQGCHDLPRVGVRFYLLGVRRRDQRQGGHLMVDRVQMVVGGLLADFGLWLYWNAKRRKITNDKEGSK